MPYEELGFPYATCNGEARPVMLTDVISFDGLRTSITFSSGMSRDDFADFEVWINLVLKKVRRWSEAYERYRAAATAAQKTGSQPAEQGDA